MTTQSNTDDDEEAMKLHLDELDKELRKKGPMDSDKVTRLLSLTYGTRRRSTLSVSATTRVSTTLGKYDCFKKPIFVSFVVATPLHSILLTDFACS